MKKRVLSILLSAVLLTALSGCASVFKKEYLSVSKYVDENRGDFSDIVRISDYEELKSAIISMVNRHKTYGRLKFTDYDGSLQSDISQACHELKSESAIVSYAVNYMSYDLNRIATYYEAAVHISYRRSQSEIDAIRYVTGRKELQEAFAAVLDNTGSYAAVKIVSSTITEEEVKNAVCKAYESNPAGCVVMPEVTVRMHPQSGVQRIIEVELKYGRELSELQEMRSVLRDRIDEISKSISQEKNAASALEACNLLARRCTYDPTGFMRSDDTEQERGLGSTAYGAIVEGNADSLGIALAYAALCRAVGIECLVVNGSMDEEDHSWNIIKIEGRYYHVDVSAWSSSSSTGDSFMKSDSQIQDRYDWDRDSYPVCG